MGVKQKALHDEDVSFLHLIASVRLLQYLRVQAVVHAVRLLKLHWVVQPGVDGAHHGVHVQRSKYYGVVKPGRRGEGRERAGGNKQKRTTKV